MRYSGILYSIRVLLTAAILVTAGSAFAIAADLVYCDSIEVVPGQDVTMHCALRNAEFLSVMAVPLTYNTDLLTLKSISFTGSRADYIGTKIITPSPVDSINGHFVVAFVKMMEAPFPPGDGLLFTATFATNPAAPIGTVTLVDSLFFPPGGELKLAEHGTSRTIIPEFKAGSVVFRQANRPPTLNTPSSVTVLEGDSLALTVTAVDPDGKPVSLACSNKPSSSTFTAAAGDGTLVWVPDFVGPFSADVSPVKVTFVASDGSLSTTREVDVHVVNRNRAPVLTAPATMMVTAGESMQFDVSATDPDFEVISWTMNGAPIDASFDRRNPARFAWAPAITSLTDTMQVEFIATDPQGFADTAIVQLTVAEATLYQMGIDTVSALPGDQATVQITLGNQLPVAGFNLLISYDPTVLSPIHVNATGTRAEDVDVFTVSYNVNGQPGTISIVGQVSSSGPAGGTLSAGDGPIAKIVFQTVSDLAYEGMSVPVKFAFTDFATRNNNTLTSAAGTKIEQTDIAYTDGFVKIMDIGDIRIGDINLNGVAIEIADAIYFTNFFISPAEYPFNLLQYANSDVNRDNITATISDLVRLINLLVNGGTPRMATGEAVGTIAVTKETSGLGLTYTAKTDVGGILVTLSGSGPIDPSQIACNDPAMTVVATQDDDKTKVLLYSLDGAWMPSGEFQCLTLTGIDSCEIVSVDMSSADGRLMDVSVVTGIETLPGDFALGQNYPNPFNPSTRIEFSLPAMSDVTLTVYDVLGRQVQALARGTYPAGRHSVVWDGRDSRGQSVASGVYFYRLDAGGTAVTRKMMLVK